MNDGADLRVHPSGKAVVSISAQTQGQGHETTFAQIVAEELGIPPEDVEVRHGDTDKSPYGLGTYGSRSTPVSGGAVAVVSRKVRDKARLIAATMLETRPEDLAWEKGRWYVKGDPEKGAMIEDIASRAYSGEAMPEGMEGGLDAQVIYDPPNLTYPYGAYIAVVDIDPDTAQVTVRRFIAVDDCGVRINPMVVEGQIHGGLAEGVGIALMELISFDEEGNCLNSSFMDYLIPTALECPDFELGDTVTPVPAPPAGGQGRRRVAQRRLAAGDRQRGHRRAARDARRRPHRHAVHARARVEGDAGAGRAAAMTDAFVTGLVLGAGGSKRLGRPKQLLPYGDGTLLGHVVDVARACPFDQVVVALGGAADDVREAVDLEGVDVVVNDDYGEGCSSSIAAALGAVDLRCDVLVLMLGDQPGVTAETVRALLAGRGDAPLAVCRYEDGRGHPIAFAQQHLRRAGRPARRQGRLAAARPTRRRGGRGADRGHHPARRGHRRGLPGGDRRGGGRGRPSCVPDIETLARRLAGRRLPRRRGPRDVDVPRRCACPSRCCSRARRASARPRRPRRSPRCSTRR